MTMTLARIVTLVTGVNLVVLDTTFGGMVGGALLGLYVALSEDD